MKIEGKVSTIIFRNESNGWTVFLLKLDKDYLTCVGETENLEVDDNIELDGEYITHKVYGEQFKFNTYKKNMPKSNEALIEYITSNVKGVGKKTASKIVEEFLDKTVDIIRYNKDKLKVIKGLNEQKINDMSCFFNEEWDKWNAIEYLSQYSISVVKASKIYKTLGKDTISIIKENPYSLLKFVNNLDFKIVDDIGKKQGMPYNDESRLNSGVMYVLNKTTEFGHTCVLYDELLASSEKMLEVSKEEIENTIIRLSMLESIFLEKINDETFIFRRSFYIAEQNIATRIISKTLMKSSFNNYTGLIEKVSKKNSLVLSEEQVKAIDTSLNNQISIITGGPRYW